MTAVFDAEKWTRPFLTLIQFVVDASTRLILVTVDTSDTRPRSKGNDSHEDHDLHESKHVEHKRVQQQRRLRGLRLPGALSRDC